MTVTEPHQSSSTETVPQNTKDNTSIFSRVNIDTFKERTFKKSSESLPKSPESSDIKDEQLTPPPSAEIPSQSPKNEPITPPVSTSPAVQSPAKDTSIFSQVNIDTFKERTFQKSSEKLSKSQEPLETTNETVPSPSSEEPLHQLPKNEPITPPASTAPSVQPTKNDTSIFSQVNIDTFKERKFEKTSPVKQFYKTF